MKILGYSERGVINALFYNTLYSPNDPNQLLSVLLNKTIFIHKKKKELFKISCCKVLIEQSFSDFGDSDVLLLIKNNGIKQAIFLEAKVKTYSGNWGLKDEFDKFLHPKKNPQSGLFYFNILDPNNSLIPSSNLFTQLYFKHRLWYELKADKGKKLEKGVPFINTTKSLRKIGKNKIVLKAINKLKDHTREAFFIGIVPETRKTINSFIPEFNSSKIILTNWNEDKYWNNANWGFLSWKDIYTFCTNKKYKLEHASTVFKYNKSQVY